MAARRLGGSLLQRAQAEERRQLVPRRFLSGDQLTNAKAEPRIFEEYPKGEIQQKKEELFKLMSEADEQYMGERRNRQLMRYLTEHVKPREDDPQWRRLSRGQKMTNWVTLMGPVSCLLATFLLPKNG